MLLDVILSASCDCTGGFHVLESKPVGTFFFSSHFTNYTLPLYEYLLFCDTCEGVIFRMKIKHENSQTEVWILIIFFFVREYLHIFCRDGHQHSNTHLDASISTTYWALTCFYIINISKLTMFYITSYHFCEILFNVFSMTPHSI